MNASKLYNESQLTELMMKFYRGYEHGKSHPNNRYDRDLR